MNRSNRVKAAQDKGWEPTTEHKSEAESAMLTTEKQRAAGSALKRAGTTFQAFLAVSVLTALAFQVIDALAASH